jgi:type IV secretory pathway ATPase VirB11/archaellum biosynthesis ATPase
MTDLAYQWYRANIVMAGPASDYKTATLRAIQSRIRALGEYHAIHPTH